MAGTVEERVGELETRLEQVEAALAALRRPPIGIPVEEVRPKAHIPVERGPDTMAKLRRIFGRFDGPEDLSTRLGEYRAAHRT